MAKNANILVLGVGNILLGDDGVGVRALELLRDSYVFPSEVSLVDGGTGGLTLASLFAGNGLVIILDAVSGDALDGAEPFEVMRIEAGTLKDASEYQIGSLHSLGVNEVLAISALDGEQPDIIIIGMVPASIAPATELSPGAIAGLSRMAELVIDELRALDITVNKQRGSNRV